MLISRGQILLACIVLFSCPVHAESIIEEMRAAWKIREARYHTGHIEFQNIENYPYLPPEKRRPLDAKIVDTVTLKHQVIFDAKRLRYSREGMLDLAAGGINNWFKVKFVTTDDSEFVSELTKYFNVEEAASLFKKERAWQARLPQRKKTRPAGASTPTD